MNLTIALFTLTLIFINYSLFFLGKLFGLKPAKYAFCGLFAYCGDEPPNLDKIKILGLYNMDRGTDSCGITINDDTFKGTGLTSRWDRFIEKHTFEDLERGDNFTVIGHTRKATLGAHSEKNAHPFELYKDDKDADPTLIFAHNGQILNWRDLCAEYKVDVKNIDVDSQGFGSILAKDKNNLKVFTEYKGYGAFLFYPLKNKNTLLLFKGKSKETTHSVASEERPLFYWEVPGKNQIYVSSLEQSLLAIGGTKETVKSFECNKLIRIEKGKFIKLKDKIANLDRSNIVTRETQTITTNTNTNSRVGNQALINYEAFENLYEFEEGASCCSKPLKRVNNPFETLDKNRSKGVPQIVSKITKNSSANSRIDEEVLKEIYNPFLMGLKVYFWRGRYYQNGHLLGALNKPVSLVLDAEGTPHDKPNCDPTTLAMYWFINGLMCKSEKDCQLLTIEFSKTKDSRCYVDWRNKDGQWVQKLNPGFVAKYLHTSTFVHHPNSYYPDAHDSETGKLANTTFIPTFSNYMYTFVNGECTEITVLDEKLRQTIMETKPEKGEVSKEFNNPEWAPGVPQENPEEDMENDTPPFNKASKGNTRSIEEMALDVFSDTLNNIRDNIETLESDITPVDKADKTLLYRTTLKLKYAEAFLSDWFEKQVSPEDDESDEIDEEETILKERESKEPIY